MKNKNVRSRLWMFSGVAMMFGIWTFLPNPVQPINIVQAGCTMTGRASYVNGTPTCDCTSATESTCSCVVACKPNGDGGDVPIDTGAS